MENGFKDELTERLMRYTAIDSQSDELSNKSPSTDQQLDMLNLLKEELLALGVEDVKLTDYGVVLATVPGNCLLYTSPSPRDATLSRMPSSA